MNKNKSLTNHKNFLVKFNANFINLKKISYNFESDINFLSFNKIFRPNRYFYKSKFLKDKLNGKKVLILGGTSDIGRIIIGFLKKNKIDLNFTYFKNKKKALKICKDFSINKNNLLFYNLKNKINKKLVKKILDCEIIIFLMTPKIFRGRYKFFNFNFFQELNKFYIAELNKFIEILVKSKKKYSLILPSSKIINYNYESNLEYSYSKLLMEKYSKSINKNFKRINVITPRLEAFKTKQTQFILGANNNINDLIKKLFYKI